MPKFIDASPQLSLRLYKTISRKTVDGQTAVSDRYAGKDEFIDLTPFLNAGSSVRTSKSVSQPAGGFSITFADKPQKPTGAPVSSMSLESIYGLIEPMDMIEIRMWNGVGKWTRSKNGEPEYPIIMRGFVSDVQRGQAISGGTPQRQVTVTGQDYGKIWQIFQVLYMAAYAEGISLLTNFELERLFGVKAKNATKSADFVRQMITLVINPFLEKLLPKNTSMPKLIQTGDSISVAHGVVGLVLQRSTGSIYDILKLHGDVGVWNEIYTEDREDGVHCVYRPIPALHLTAPEGASDRRIQDDAPKPIYVDVPSSEIEQISVTRSDSNVGNFFWVNNTQYDLIYEMQRKLESIPKDDGKVSLKDYPNAAFKYYGVRAMYAETQQSGDEIKNVTAGLPDAENEERGKLQEAWIDKRRRQMVEMNRDNVVFERGSMRIKGGPMRSTGGESMKAGDYVTVIMGRIVSSAYVTQIDHEFMPFQSYTTTLTFERGEGFVERIAGDASSPWLAEQASDSVRST